MGLDPAMQAGQRLGRYTLVRSLGAGGMAELFLARADGIGGFTKLVALKRILPQKAKNERFVRMLLNEARLVASLEHPNIAAVYDICFEDHEYFFAMEYVHGQDLRRIIRAAPNHMLRLENVLHIIIGICAGLHHAHEARDPAGKPLEIVHRDVSPSNILVSYQGAIKVVDFGVAKAATMVSETREGIIKGKHGYMSPEQCLGEKLDRRSDLFAVGILLWEMTVGRRLYKLNGELATLQRIVYSDAPKPSQFIEGCPPELERIIMRALTRDLGARYQTAEEIQLDLEAFALAHQLPVSPVAMTMEMSELFRDRIDAWREAEHAGRSLADHLADISSEDAVYSGSGDSASGDSEGGDGAMLERADSDVSEVTDVRPETLPAKSLLSRRVAPATPSKPITTIGPGLPAATPRTPASGSSPRLATHPVTGSSPLATQPVTASSPRLAQLPPAAEAGPIASDAGHGRGRRAAVIILTVALVGGAAAAAWLLWLRGPSTGDTEEPRIQLAVVSPDASTARTDPAPDASSEGPVQDFAPDHGTAIDVTQPAATEDGDPPDAGSGGSVRPAKGTGRVKPRTTATRPKDVKTGAPPDEVAPKEVAPKEVAPKEPCQPPGKLDPFDKRPVCAAASPPAKVETPIKATAPVGPAPGTIDAAQVRAFVKAHIGEITTCVSRARMDDRDLAGKVLIRIDVAPTGSVSRTTVVSATGATPSLESCMQRAIAGWTLPAPAGGVRGAFTYPFSF
jgi:serine/threonine protein kinase